MAARAIWKGSIKIAELVCPVAMYTAATTSERISLNLVNRDTGNRLRRVYMDEKTKKPVEAEDQVKGYEASQGKHVILEPEEIAAAVPNSDKVLTVDNFISCGQIETTFFDKPYYLLPANDAAEEAFVLVREALKKSKAAAIAHTVLFRRLRPVLIRAHRKGLIATTLNFDYEVRSAKAAFKDISARKIDAEMMEFAQHILSKKAGKFDPSKFDDRYEQALADLVKAKIEGRKIIPFKKPEPTKPNNLLEALRMSAGGEEKVESKPAKRSRKSSAAKTEKAAPRKKAS
ncbi:DNA end-binding protein Ku [Devosia lucknowensis]|uniref:Non-homologous end joining protein Ku n=1 Tax=Devosia lucknowensis TaxID=1096929 RepID=A0A1Y6ESP5_9HYPH|nr:Ku protein [Devosia lucknowensis]SMQ65758.1 DNA end-binding protein Ku [Devosia lucknowensis]